MNHTPVYHFSTFPTPAGEFSVAVDPDGAVAATAFGGRAALAKMLHGAALVADAERTAPARGEVEAWFRGERKEFSVALAPEGTDFQKRVWGALRRIPYGQTRSYGEVAREVGSSPRAVGRANATNPIGLIVPCHRVIGADGSLVGYASGEKLKRWLLDFEGA